MTDEEYYELMCRLDERAVALNRTLSQRFAKQIDREIMECDIPEAFREAFND